MKILLMCFVFLAGVLQPFQAGMNAIMGKQLGDRFQAGFLNGFVNVCLLSLVLIVFWRGFPSIGKLSGAPWWAFLAGGIGATIVVVQLSAAPILGGAILVALFVAGQIVGSISVDSFGLAGYPVRVPSVVRIVGLCLIVVGVLLATASMGKSPAPKPHDPAPVDVS